MTCAMLKHDLTADIYHPKHIKHLMRLQLLHGFRTWQSPSLLASAKQCVHAFSNPTSPDLSASCFTLESN